MARVESLTSFAEGNNIGILQRNMGASIRIRRKGIRVTSYRQTLVGQSCRTVFLSGLLSACAATVPDREGAESIERKKMGENHINDISVKGTAVAFGQDAHEPSDDGPSNETPSHDLTEWCKKWRIDNEKRITFPKNLGCIPRQIENLVHDCEKPRDTGKTDSLLLGEFPAAYFRHMAAQYMGWVLPEDGFVKCVCQARLKAWYENAYKTSDGTLQVIKEYACRLAMQNPKHFMTAYIEKTCTAPERYGEKEAAVLLKALGPSEFPGELDRINREMLLRALAHFHNTFPEHPDADRVAFALGVFIWQAAGDQTDKEKRHAYVARSMDILSSLEGSEGELASLASLAMALYCAQKGQCAKANRKLDEIKKKSVIHTCHP